MAGDQLEPAVFRRILARSVVAPLLLLGALALMFVGQILYLLSAARAVDHSGRVIARGNALLKLLVDGETGMRGFVITNDPVFPEPYNAEEEQNERSFDELTALVADDPVQVALLTKLRHDHDEWQDFAQRVIALRRSGGDYLGPIQRREGKRRMDAIRVQIAAFITAEERLRDERARTTNRATWLISGFSLGLALLLGAALAAVTRTQLRRVSASYRSALTAAEERAEALRRAAHRLETLHQIDRAILAADSTIDLVRSALQRAHEIVPSGDSFVVATDPTDGTNRTFARAEPHAAPAPDGPDAWLLLAGADGPRVFDDLGAMSERSTLHERLYRAGNRSCLAVALQTGDERYGVLVFTDHRPSAFTDEHGEVAHEIARQLAIALQQTRFRERLRPHADDLERRVEERTRELQESLNNVKQLQGMLPICAWCKKVRDDQNYWHQVENYTSARTDAWFTHGICPACLQMNEDEIERLTKN